LKHNLSAPAATPPVPVDLPLTARQAALEAGLSLAAFWRAVAASRLPDPVYPLPKAPRWFRGEIRDAMMQLRMKPAVAKVWRAADRSASDRAPAA
jgi:predicted DNA-binding transcriptional regulator AlpA